jgi:hypothetical protein
VIIAGVVASLPLELPALNCTVGAGSSSIIVTVELDGLPSVAPPVGFDSVTVNHSLGSFRVSFVIATENVLLAVSPLVQERFPLVKV